MRQRWMRARDSLRGARYPVDLGPPVLRSTAELLRLPDYLTLAWWRALARATWSDNVAWRERALTFHPERQDPRVFFETACSPRALVALWERLVAERVLSRSAATAMEDTVFRQTDAEGDWCVREGGGRNDAT